MRSIIAIAPDEEKLVRRRTRQPALTPVLLQRCLDACEVMHAVPHGMVLERRSQTLAAGDWRIAQAQSVLAASLLAQHRGAEALPLMEAADRVLKPVPGVQGREYAANQARLSSLPVRSRSSK